MSDDEDQELRIVSGDPFDDPDERKRIRYETAFSKSARPFLRLIVAVMANRRALAFVGVTAALLAAWANEPGVMEALGTLFGGRE